MNKQFLALAPMITSEAGSCLSAENLQEIGIKLLAFDMAALLMKPGAGLLSQIDSLGNYYAWAGHVSLNASRLSINAEGLISLRSTYDGSLIQLSTEALIELMVHLKPNYLILSLDFTNQLQFIKQLLPECRIWILEEEQLPSYQRIEKPIDEWPQYFNKALQFIESNRPAADAIQGTVYVDNTSINILDELHANSFEAISKDCTCPSCSKKQSRAYLHHLLLHTPLLAERYLIQHNLVQSQKILEIYSKSI